MPVVKRTHIVVPDSLAVEIDRVVGKRSRSKFLAEAATHELKRLKALKALDRAAGSWKDEDHPELAKGAAAWIRRLRQEGRQRRRRLNA